MLMCLRVRALPWARGKCGREDLNSPSFRGVRSTPWNPQLRGRAVRCRYLGETNRGIPARSARMTAETVDAGGSPSPPSSSRSGDPQRRGNAVRCRYPYATNRGIPARSARMTAGFENALSLPLRNQPGDCVVAKSARLRFHLVAKASLAPLLLLFGRDLLRWVRVRGEGCRLRSL